MLSLYLHILCSSVALLSISSDTPKILNNMYSYSMTPPHTHTEKKKIPMEPQLSLHCPVCLGVVTHTNKLSSWRLPGKSLWSNTSLDFHFKREGPQSLCVSFPATAQAHPANPGGYGSQGPRLLWHTEPLPRQGHPSPSRSLGTAQL